MITTRSLIAIASDWSWVTYSNVIPSRCCCPPDSWFRDRFSIPFSCISSATIKLPMPYTLFPVMCSTVFVMRRCLPNRKMMDRDRM